jgi:hypothetical protein
LVDENGNERGSAELSLTYEDAVAKLAALGDDDE